MLSSTLKGAQLSFKAQTIDIPLGKLVDHALSAKGSGSISAPEIAAPIFDDNDLELHPVRQLAIREILKHADHGDVLVNLPLAMREIKAGPISIEVPKDTAIEIEAAVRDTALVRERTFGRIVPPLKLPLGMQAREIRIDENGNVLLDISGLPDINLTRLGRAPKIPTALDELLDEFMNDDKSDADSFDGNEGSDEAAKENRASEFDASRITVQARNISPRAEQLDLGRAGTITVGKDTRIDVDLTRERIVLRGRVQVTDAELHGRSFRLEGIEGTADVHWSLEGLDKNEDERAMIMRLSCLGARVKRAHFVLKDQSRAFMSECEIGPTDVTFHKTPSTLTYSAHVRDAIGIVDDAEIALGVGSNICPVSARGNVKGELKVSERHLDVDINLHEVELRTAELALDLGVLDVVLSPVNAKASGHLKAGTDYGMAFSGDLDIDAQIERGTVTIDQLRAGLASRSKATLKVAQLAGGVHGLDVLEASGVLHLNLNSGSIPLGPKAELTFSEGAHSTVILEEVALLPGHRFPKVCGTGHLVAEADPVTIEPLVELPGGRASLDGNFDVDPNEGHLLVSDLNMRLVTKDA